MLRFVLAFCLLGFDNASVPFALALAGFEHNAPTCDTAARNGLNDFYRSSSEAMWPIGRSSLDCVPARCLPTMLPNRTVGAWYSFTLSSNLTGIDLRTTFTTVGTVASTMSVFSGSCGSICGDQMNCISYAESPVLGPFNTTANFTLTTNHQYYFLVLMENSANLTTLGIRVMPSCEDPQTALHLAEMFGGAAVTKYCEESFPPGAFPVDELADTPPTLALTPSPTTSAPMVYSGREELPFGTDMRSEELNLEEGGFYLYYIELPLDTLMVSCSASVSNLKLYMRKDRIPSPTATLNDGYDCATIIGGQVCDVLAYGGEVYILAEAVGSAVSGGEVSCEVALDPTSQELYENEATLIALGDSYDFDLMKNEARLFSMMVPQGTTAAYCVVQAETFSYSLRYTLVARDTNGNVDIPDIANEYGECIPGSECEYRWPGGTSSERELFIAMSTSEALVGIAIQCRANLPPLDAQSAEWLVLGQEATDKTINEGESLYFYFSVPAGSSAVTCTTDAEDGDLDLYMNLYSLPTDNDFDCMSISPTSTESCTVYTSHTNAYMFVRLHAWESSSTVDVRRFSLICEAPGAITGSRDGNPDLP